MTMQLVQRSTVLTLHHFSVANFKDFESELSTPHFIKVSITLLTSDLQYMVCLADLLLSTFGGQDCICVCVCVCVCV